ncbi:MAG: ABC transporter substrate-binding protein [Candidatus Odinarchaeota archaeon]
MKIHKHFFIFSLTVLLFLSAFQVGKVSTNRENAATTVYPLTLTDGYGRNVTFDSEPVRVISIAPSATEVIFAVGAGDKVVAVDAYSNYPAENITEINRTISTYPTLDMEDVISLSPDVVFAAGIISQDDITSLGDQGVTVFVLAPFNLEDIMTDIDSVGKITNHVDEATTLINSLQARINTVKEYVAANFTAKPKVYVETSDYGGYWTYGNGTYGHDIIELAGGINIAENATGLYPMVDSEFIITQNPDIIFYTEGSWTTTNITTISNRTGWNVINAVKNAHVYPINEDWISRGGPRIVDALEEINGKLRMVKVGASPFSIAGFEWLWIPVMSPVAAITIWKRRKLNV